MNAGRVRGMRRVLAGWMRPSVAKVGAVQVGTGVIAVSGAEGADAFGSPRNGRPVMAPARSLVPRLWIPAALCVVLFALSWSEEAMADIKLAMSRKPPPDPYELQAPALSPDGTRAALAVSFYGHREHLVLYDIERDTLRVVDKLDHERWRSPSFSPTGDTIAFIRSCTTCEDKGYQLATYDVATGRTKTLTQGSDLHRYMPVFSPSGRFVAYRSKRITWEGDTPDVVGRSAGFRTYTLATNTDRQVPLERFDVGGFCLRAHRDFSTNTRFCLRPSARMVCEFVIVAPCSESWSPSSASGRPA